MQPFSYSRAADPESAVRAHRPGARFLAGGTNLLDLMKEGIERPSALVDLTRLELTQIGFTDERALTIGALSTNTDTANHPLVRQHFPLLSQAILAGASAQLRNMATAGGNLNQRTRCPYFYEAAMPCNKRTPGSGCSAREGIHRSHAIFGWSEACVATHPSDMCVALVALDAHVELLASEGRRRRLAMADYHRLPGQEAERDNHLEPGELVLALTLPENRLSAHSCYLKVRERTSYAFALVSVAAALELMDDVITDVRIALGGVAHKPWRATDAERVLLGQRATDEHFAAAASAEMQGARPLANNGFKVELGRRLIARALKAARRGTAH